MTTNLIDRVVVTWIPIVTPHHCGAILPIGGGRSRCLYRAEWEEVRATGPDGLPIDMGRPRIRCAGHVPESTPEVEHRRGE